MPVPAVGEGRLGKHVSSRDDQKVTWAHRKVEAQAGERSLRQCLGKRSRWQHLSGPGTAATQDKGWRADVMQ